MYSGLYPPEVGLERFGLRFGLVLINKPPLQVRRGLVIFIYSTVTLLAKFLG